MDPLKSTAESRNRPTGDGTCTEIDPACQSDNADNGKGTEPAYLVGEILPEEKVW